MRGAETVTSAEPRPSALRRAAVPTAIFFAVILLDLVYVSRPAYVWDETYYWPSSLAVRNWVAHPSLDEDVINVAFRQGNAHPPLPLFVMAATGAVFQSAPNEFLFAIRMATALQFAALALIVYTFVKREAGLVAAAFAAGLTVLSPRLFAHSLMATYDVSLCLWWTAATICFYRGMTSRRWAIASGFVFGLALLTKVNAVLLPAALWPWGICFYRRRSLAAIVSMAVAGPIVFFAGWPWLWLHPLAHTAEYLVDKFPSGVLPSFVLAWTGTEAITWRTPAEVLYFGRLGVAPWHYPFVMFVVTMPLATLFGAVAGAVRAARLGERRPLAVLLWWSVLVQLLVFAFAMKPFDGLRIFLPVLPLAAMAGGMGLAALFAGGRRWAVAAVIVAALSPGVEFFVYEPWGMSYYSPLVGGLPGAEKLGMEVSYYGEAVTSELFDAINESAQGGEDVAYGPMFQELPQRMPLEYQRYGYLRGDLGITAMNGDWDYAIEVNRGGYITEQYSMSYEPGPTIARNRLLGVPLAQVVQRRRASGRE